MHFLLKIWFIKGKMLFNKDEWAKIPPQNTHCQFLFAVLASKGGTTTTFSHREGLDNIFALINKMII